MLDMLKDRAKKIILDAGAEYIGPFDGTRLVLFNSRQTGSTLALRMETILIGGVEAVQQHVKASNARFGV